MPSNHSTEAGSLSRVLPQSVESTPSQQLQPGYFNWLPVELVQHIANQLTLPDALRLKQTCHNTHHSIDQRTIKELMCRIQFKNMETAADTDADASKCENLKSFYNSGKFPHIYTRYEYDQNSGLVNNPERVNIERFFAIMKLDNATTKYQDEIYTMYTGLFENGHVFLIAPNDAFRIIEDPDTNNPNKILFNGNTFSVGVDAIYSGRSFQEVKKLINTVHSGTPLSNHITHILEHEHK